MSLPDALRGELRRAVQDVREELTKDLEQRLEGDFGVDRSGRFSAASDLPLLARDSRAADTRRLIERLLTPLPVGSAPKQQERFAEEFDQLVRAVAFTHLNRFVAFKLMEHESRRLVRESVGPQRESRGVARYRAAHPEEERAWREGRRAEVYERFLLDRTGELDRQIGALFDPDDLASRLFPTPRTLEKVLDILNQPTLAAAWADEETLGWVYQYYTPKDLRDSARKKHRSGPPDSYHLAFLNQFYTPHYVVRFLVDNTLGRLWLGMLPYSRLRQHCRLLALDPSETPLPRPMIDPRSLKVLDPACGSGHFLLYAFELLEIVYREAWNDPKIGPSLHEDFGTFDAFEAEVPRLIVEHNLHGIDIDARAAQIATLALFLKAKSRNPKVVIERSNVVWAAPLPGDRDLFEEFKRGALSVQQGAIARILDALWEHLQLAGEAGSLLKAEDQLGKLVSRERKLWAEQQGGEAGKNLELFPDAALPQQRRLDFSDVTDETFFDQAADRIERLLADFAIKAEGAEGAYRRLFAKNSAQGIQFVELLRHEYHVVLMNPPFGASAKGAKAYIDKTYPRTKNDLYAAFVERFVHRLVPGGFLGAITSRTGFFLTSYQAWREEVLLADARLVALADLGHGVLDTAMVETAAYCLERT